MTFIIQWIENSAGAEDVIKINTPTGQLVLTSQQGVINKVEWSLDEPVYAQHHELQRPFEQYGVNPNKHINIKLLKQGSAYRHKVWAELCKIPFGETMTYFALAQKIDSSARAVGNACRDNPYPVIIPCHRLFYQHMFASGDRLQYMLEMQIGRAGHVDRVQIGIGQQTG